MRQPDDRLTAIAIDSPSPASRAAGAPIRGRHRAFALGYAMVALFLSCLPPAHADDHSPMDSPVFEQYRETAQDLIAKGLEMVGVSYRRGGTDPLSGLDCSGFVQLVFRESIGRMLPRTSREMSQLGDRVEKQALQPGDLVFFNTMRRTFSHVGIYVGEGRFLHAPRPGGEVRVEDMGGRYWMKRYNGARRILDN